MKVVAVVVLYFADGKKLSSLLKSICHQCKIIIIVKNDNADYPVLGEFGNVVVLDLKRNYGIAYAQNRGIEKALELGAKWILLSDQDTLYPQDYIKNMLISVERNKLENIGAVTPSFYDEVKKQFAPIMVGKTKKMIPTSGQIYKITHSISSGTIVPVSTFRVAGLMKEELFIDFVDNEWFWRLLKYNLNIYCISDIVIHHQLGDKVEKKLGIKIVSRSLFRFYYIIRNGYFLLEHTDYLKGRDRFLFFLLMKKKIVEVLMLNNFNEKSRTLVKEAIKNGKYSNFIVYDK